MLNVQYRMNPYLMQVPNQLFYGHKIQCDPTQSFEYFIHQERPLIFINVEGEEEFFDPSYYNEEEARTVKTLLEDLIDEFNYPKEWFSIITPYQG